MKTLSSLLQKYSFVLLLLFLLVVIFNPVLLKGEIPFSSNLLVSFFNPWAQEKFPGWSQGIPNKPVGIDDLRIFYPQRHFTLQTMEKGMLPLWNQYSFSGTYHAGLSETAVFYPLFFLFFLFPQLPTWIFLMLLEPVLVSIGTYVFLRLLVKNKASAIFGALTLGFSGLVIVRMGEGLSVGHTLLWAPFVLYGIEGFLQKRKLRFLCILLLSLCFSLFAGWFQFAFYTIALGFLYALFRWIGEREKRKTLLVFLPFLLLPLLTLFHIIPSLELFAVSSRGATTIQELLNLHLLSWSHIFTYLFPDFWGNPGSYNFFGKSEYKESILYIGVVPFILALFSLSFVRKNGSVIFFSVLSIVSIVLGIDTPIARAILSLPIPIVSSFLPDRIFFFATIGLSVLSAYGFDTIVDKKLPRIKTAIITIGIAAVVFVVNGYVFASQFPKLFSFLLSLQLIQQSYQLIIAKHNVIVPDLFVAGFVVVSIIGRLSKKILIAGMFVLLLIGQIYFAQKYIPFSQPQFVFPKNDVFTFLQQSSGINRFISTGNGYIPSNMSLFYNLYSPDGVGSMYIARYGQLVTYMQSKGRDSQQIPRIEIRIDPSADEVLSGNNPYLLRFLQIDGVQYIVRLKSDPATVNTHLFQKVFSNNTWEIYAYTDTLPRIFWSDSAVVEKNPNALLTDVFHPLQKNTIYLEKALPMPLGKGIGSVKILTYASNNISVQTNATTNGIVYISDTFAPQFHVTIDGKPGTSQRGNFSYTAVFVPKGNHIVTLSYTDSLESFGFLIALSSVLLTGFGMLYVIKKKYLLW